MIQVLDEYREPSTKERFGEAFAKTAGQAAVGIPQMIGQRLSRTQNQQAENQYIDRLFGEGASGLSPSMREKLFPEMLKQQSNAQKLMETQQEKGKMLHVAANALNEMENMIGKKGIGMLGQYNPSAEARENRGIFESTQAAILPVFKQLFPRGMTQNEFKIILARWIPSASDTEAKIRGKIQGLKLMLSNPDSMTPEMALEGPHQEKREVGSKARKRPPLSSFHR